MAQLSGGAESWELVEDIADSWEKIGDGGGGCASAQTDMELEAFKADDYRNQKQVKKSMSRLLRHGKVHGRARFHSLPAEGFVRVEFIAASLRISESVVLYIAQTDFKGTKPRFEARRVDSHWVVRATGNVSVRCC